MKPCGEGVSMKGVNSARITLEPLTRTLNLVFSNFLPYLVIGLIIMIGQIVASWSTGFNFSWDSKTEDFNAIFFTAMTAAAIVQFVIGQVLAFAAAINTILWSGAASAMIAKDLQAPGTATAKYGVEQMRSRLTPLIALGVVYAGIQLVMPFVFCVGPIFAAALYLLFAFSVPIIMQSRSVSMGQALKASSRLVRERLAGVLGFMIVAGILCAFLSILLGLGLVVFPAAITLLYLSITLPHQAAPNPSQ